MLAKYKLHDWQQASCDLDIQHIKQAKRDEAALVGSPTGTGKSIMQLYVQSQLPNCWIITPKVEIVIGMLDKLGINTSKMSKQKIEDKAFSLQICTPIRLRNMLMAGKDIKIRSKLDDEGHHTTAETHVDLDTLLRVPSVLYTATPFRGTPKQTKLLRDKCGPPRWAITYQDAAAQGYINVPICSTQPLVDDDKIEIVNGEFVLESVSSLYNNRLEDICRLIKLDKPTMISLPGHDMILNMERYCTKHKIPFASVVSETDNLTRQRAFKACIDCKAVLLQINVVSEGVDLPIRRLIDCSPTLSPVKWLQQLGRITRPSDDIAEYICTNRNIQRHAYLLEGLLPLDVIIQSQVVFPPPARAGVRVMGLECIGKFQPIEMPLASGITGHIYCVASADPSNSSNIINYAAIIHPAVADPIWATQIKVKKEWNAETSKWDMEYGKWERCEQPTDLVGFKSIPTGKITVPMENFWKASYGAKAHGLDPKATVTKKNFQALPILKDLRIRLI